MNEYNDLIQIFKVLDHETKNYHLDYNDIYLSSAVIHKNHIFHYGGQTLIQIYANIELDQPFQMLYISWKFHQNPSIY